MSTMNGNLTRPSPDVLELSPVAFQRPSHFRLPGPFTAVFTILTGLGISAMAAVACAGVWWTLTMGVWGPALLCGVFAGILLWAIYLLVLGAFSSGMWFQFDLNSREVIRLQRPFGFWRLPRPVASWNLNEVEALHLIYGGLQTVEHTQQTQSGQWDTISWTTQHHVYRFELAMKPESGTEPVILTASYDWAWLREFAPQISEFCGVPVLDELCHETPVAVDSSPESAF